MPSLTAAALARGRSHSVDDLADIQSVSGGAGASSSSSSSLPSTTSAATAAMAATNERRNTISTSPTAEAAARGKEPARTSRRAIWDKRRKRKDREGELPRIKGQKNAVEDASSARRKIRRRLSSTKKRLMPCDNPDPSGRGSSGSVLPGIKACSSVSGVHLSQDVLDARRRVLLARVKQGCDSERQKIERKQQRVARLKARQQAWVGENLMLDKGRLQRSKIALAEKRQMEEEEQAAEEADILERKRLRHIEMRQKWLQRQREKKRKEDRKREKLSEQQHMLDQLSLVRQQENQAKYKAWVKRKKEKRMQQQLLLQQAGPGGYKVGEDQKQPDEERLQRTSPEGSPIMRQRPKKHHRNKSSVRRHKGFLTPSNSNGDYKLSNRMHGRLHGFEDVAEKDSHAHMGQVLFGV
jgi:hypothetical protein